MDGEVLRHRIQGPCEQSQPGEPFYGINASNCGRVMIFAGGIPSQRNGTIIGVIGVSGGDGDQDQDQDQTVAEAGAGALS